jgi:hypothetical protein
MSSRERGIGRIVAAAKGNDFFIGCLIKPTETEARKPPTQAYYLSATTSLENPFLLKQP